jgi:hypothetical protein
MIAAHTSQNETPTRLVNIGICLGLFAVELVMFTLTVGLNLIPVAVLAGLYPGISKLVLIPILALGFVTGVAVIFLATLNKQLSMTPGDWHGAFVSAKREITPGKYCPSLSFYVIMWTLNMAMFG